MGRSSLRTITNINIDGQAVDAVTQSRVLTFKVNCDSLSWVHMRHYDNTAGTSQLFYYPKGGKMIAKHNGDTFRGHFGMDEETGLSDFILGHDYTVVPTIFQNYPESVEHPDNTGPGKYDVLLGSGRISEAVSGTQVFIGKNITSILSPNRYEGRLIGGCMLQIDGVQTLIESYNKSTGIAVLESSVTAPAGKLFYLVSNYLECEPFNWYCRSDPDVVLTAEVNADGVHATGSYSQAEEVAMQYYQFSFNGEQGDKCFTYTFADTFPLPPEPNGLEEPVSCEVMTQENHYSSFSASLTVPVIDTETMSISAAENTAYRIVTVSVMPGISISEGVRYFLWRREGSDGWTLRRTGVISGATNIAEYTPGTGKTYSYALCFFKDGTVYYADCSLTVRGRRVKISALSERPESYHRRAFTIAESRYFDIGSEQGSISCALGTRTVSTQKPQPTAIYSNENYDSGTLTVYADQLGSITEPIVPGIDRLTELEDFLSQKCPFLILDNAGNSHIAAITGLSREHDYGSGLGRLTVGWTELCRTGDALI